MALSLRLLAFMHGLRSGVPCGHRSREARGSESTEDGGHGLRLTLATEADTQAFGGAQTASLSEWPSESAVEGHPGRRAYRRAASRSLMRQLLVADPGGCEEGGTSAALFIAASCSFRSMGSESDPDASASV